MRAAVLHTHNSDLSTAPIVFELSALNVDKPPLSRATLMERLAQFHPDHPQGRELAQAGIVNYAVCITSKPLFLQKAQSLPHAHFIIGTDTFSRLIDSTYYKPKQLQPYADPHTENLAATMSMVSALTTVADLGCTFIVGGRVNQKSLQSGVASFETMKDVLAGSSVAVALPACVRGMFSGLAESEFRLDLSSTELRRRAEGK